MAILVPVYTPNRLILTHIYTTLHHIHNMSKTVDLIANESELEDYVVITQTSQKKTQKYDYTSKLMLS